MRDYSSLLRELDHLTVTGTDGSLCALLVIYIPRIDEMNLAYGYETGEQIIDSLTSAIAELLRERDMLTRIGSQEYSVLLRDLSSPGQAMMAAQKICELSTQPLRIDDLKIKVKLNIGISYYPEHSTNSSELIRQAGMAARMAARDRVAYSVYSEDNIPGDNRITLEHSLEEAIENAEIKAHYQPIINLNSQHVVSFEALARWDSSEHGFIPPGTFIEIAEQSDLIRNLTTFMFNTVMREYPQLSRLFPGTKISVNLSPALLGNQDIVEILTRALNIWDMPPESLIIEITESAIMEDRDKSSRILEKFNELGIELAVDDFGMGQSSLKYIKHLAISEIKIDKSFILNLAEDEHDAKIVSGIIDLAHRMNMEVVAEGIENEAAMNMLCDMGCEYGQGFYFARPMPVGQIADWTSNTGLTI